MIHRFPGPMCPPRRPKVKRRDGLDGQVRTGSLVCRRQSIVDKLAEGRYGILSHLICLALRSDLAAKKLIFWSRSGSLPYTLVFREFSPSSLDTVEGYDVLNDISGSIKEREGYIVISYSERHFLASPKTGSGSHQIVLTARLDSSLAGTVGGAMRR